MGIVNVTPDSFSDGGRFADAESAVARGRALAAAGADLIDVGGESTRPGAEPVPVAEELRRVIPVVRELADAGLTVSIDTRRAAVAEQALAAGAGLVNDVSGGADPEMAPLVARAGVDWVLMHARGDAGSAASYRDVVAEVRDELLARRDAAVAGGVDPARIVLDPGIGFAKDPPHNWALLAATRDLAGLGHRLLIGASRKRFLGALEPGSDPEERDLATAAVSALVAERGAWAVRVHDVAATRTALAVADAVRAARPGDRATPEADEIRLTGLRCRAHHGVFDAERREGQEFVVDVVLRLPLRVAAEGDDLGATVHYGVLAERIAAAVERDPVDLIETVAERVAEVALGFAPVREVVATVHKPSAPIGIPFDDVSVTVVRSRS